MRTAYDAMWDSYDEYSLLVIVETALGEPVDVYGPYHGVSEAKIAYDKKSYIGEVGTSYEVFSLNL